MESVHVSSPTALSAGASRLEAPRKAPALSASPGERAPRLADCRNGDGLRRYCQHRLEVWGWRDGRVTLRWLLSCPEVSATFLAVLKVEEEMLARKVPSPCGLFIAARKAGWVPRGSEADIAAKRFNMQREVSRAQLEANERQILLAEYRERQALLEAIRQRMPLAFLAQLDQDARRNCAMQGLASEASVRVELERLILGYSDVQDFSRFLGGPASGGAAQNGSARAEEAAARREFPSFRPPAAPPR